MKRTIAVAAVLAAGVAIAIRPLQVWSDAPKPAADDAIRKMLSEYAAAYSNGDADACARYFTTDAVFTDEDGQTVTGREAVRNALRELFQSAKGLKLDVTVENCRQLVPDACSVTANASVRRNDGTTIHNQCRLIVVQRDGAWLIAEARETPTSAAASETSPLAQLAWMVGEWNDASDRVDVHISCDWMADKHFLARTFTVTTDGQLDLQGTEILGYDPVQKQVRSWIFDSDGTFSEGTWKHEGKTWTESVKGILADGRRATALHHYTPSGQDSYIFNSTSREVGGQLQPDIADVKMVRQSSEK